MRFDIPYRVQYVSPAGEEWTELYPTYKTASIAAAILHDQGNRIVAIFRDNGSQRTPGAGNQFAPPRWLRWLGSGL
jgi:hypothetical protein